MKLALIFFLMTTFSCFAQFSSQTFKYHFPEFKVATAEYPEGPTGMTLFYFPKGATGAVDIRGGAAAVSEASSIDILNTWGYLDAVVLAGGSTFGLESASGVMQSILKLRGNVANFDTIPSVPAAIVYDFAGRNNSIYPDKNLGILAFSKLAENQVQVGEAGAGSFVTVGKYIAREKAERSGQGAAFIQVGDIKIFVLTVLNAVGAIHDNNGKVVLGNIDTKSSKRESVAQSLMKKQAVPFKSKENTTITIIITNADISRADLKRLAVMGHTSMGATIRPFHTPWDGDTLFAVSTNSKKLPKNLSVADLGVLASELLNTAVLRAAKAENY